jgi:hypothetical protein
MCCFAAVLVLAQVTMCKVFLFLCVDLLKRPFSFFVLKQSDNEDEDADYDDDIDLYIKQVRVVVLLLSCLCCYTYILHVTLF